VAGTGQAAWEGRISASCLCLPLPCLFTHWRAVVDAIPAANAWRWTILGACPSTTLVRHKADNYRRHCLYYKRGYLPTYTHYREEGEGQRRRRKSDGGEEGRTCRLYTCSATYNQLPYLAALTRAAFTTT